MERWELVKLQTQHLQYFSGASLPLFRRTQNFLWIAAVYSDECRCGDITLQKNHSQSHWGTCTFFLFVLYTPLGTYLLSGRSTTVWKRDPITGTISGKLFSLLSFRAGWDADRLRAWASSRLTSFIGREAEGRVKLFTTDALSEKQENTFQPGVRRDESKCFMALFDWNISCGAGKDVAHAGRKAFCQISLSAPQQPYPSEYIPSRGHACQPKAVFCGFASSAVNTSVWRRCLWKPPGFTHSLYSSLTPFLHLAPHPPLILK